MDDLTARIRAAIDEDERLAKQAAWSVADHTYAPVDVDDEKTEMTGHWTARGVLGVHKRVTVEDPGWDPKVTDVVWREVGDHIVRHDPARTLAMVAAHRAILAEHQLAVSKHEQLPYDALTGERNPDSYDVECARCGWVSSDPASGCPSLLALAKGYGIVP